MPQCVYTFSYKWVFGSVSGFGCGTSDSAPSCGNLCTSLLPKKALFSGTLQGFLQSPLFYSPIENRAAFSHLVSCRHHESKSPLHVSRSTQTPNFSLCAVVCPWKVCVSFPELMTGTCAVHSRACVSHRGWKGGNRRRSWRRHEGGYVPIAAEKQPQPAARTFSWKVLPDLECWCICHGQHSAHFIKTSWIICNWGNVF